MNRRFHPHERDPGVPPREVCKFRTCPAGNVGDVIRVQKVENSCQEVERYVIHFCKGFTGSNGVVGLDDLYAVAFCSCSNKTS